MIRVKFKKGQRAYETEEVDALTREEIASTIKFILEQIGDGGRELLKPFKMAHASPRVFWNLARMYDGDVARGLRALDLVPPQQLARLWVFAAHRVHDPSD